MAKKATNGKPSTKARCISVARKGVKTGSDFADFMSSLMSDIIEGRVTPDVGNATCNAGGKLLKVVEMEYRYGRPSRTTSGVPTRPRLMLSTDL